MWEEASLGLLISDRIIIISIAITWNICIVGNSGIIASIIVIGIFYIITTDCVVAAANAIAVNVCSRRSMIYAGFII